MSRGHSKFGVLFRRPLVDILQNVLQRLLERLLKIPVATDEFVEDIDVPVDARRGLVRAEDAKGAALGIVGNGASRFCWRSMVNQK